MTIDANAFRTALVAAGLIGAVACGGDPEPAETESAPPVTTGSEDMTPPDTFGAETTPPEPEPESEELGPTPE